MALDVVALEAALPAETVTAVAGLTLASQVVVQRQPPRLDGLSAWWLAQLATPEEPPGLGAVRVATVYRLTFQVGADGTGDRAAIQRAVEEARDHFHGFKRPAAIAGHLSTEVLEASVDVHQQEAPALAGALVVVFHGED